MGVPSFSAWESLASASILSVVTILLCFCGQVYEPTPRGPDAVSKTAFVRLRVAMVAVSVAGIATLGVRATLMLRAHSAPDTWTVASLIAGCIYFTIASMPWCACKSDPMRLKLRLLWRCGPRIHGPAWLAVGHTPAAALATIRLYMLVRSGGGIAMETAAVRWHVASLVLVLLQAALAASLSAWRSRNGAGRQDAALAPLLGVVEMEEAASQADERGVPVSNPLDHAGSLAKATFSWLRGVLQRGSRRQLDMHDVPLLPAGDRTAYWAARFEAALTLERQSNSPSLLRALHRTFGSEYYYLGVLQLLNDLLGFSGPLLLKLIVTFVEDRAEGITSGSGGSQRGAVLLVVVVACYGAAALFSTQYGFRIARVQLHVRQALTAAVYNQVLRCPTAQLPSIRGVGKAEATNLISVDVQRIVDAASSFNQAWSLPLLVAITLFLLYREVSYAFLAGLSVIAFMIPVNMLIANAITDVTQEQMTFKDRRVQTCDEILQGIRTIKMLAWEDVLCSVLNALRGKEVSYLASRKYLDAWCVYFWATTPILSSFCTFVMVAVIGHSLSPASVFTSISLISMLIFPMNAFPWILNGLMEARVSRRRLQTFLLDLGPASGRYLRHAEPGKHSDFKEAITVVDVAGTFAWDADAVSGTSDPASDADVMERDITCDALDSSVALLECDSRRERDRCGDRGTSTFVLRDVNFRVQAGEVIGVYGMVGSGKSTLLMTILGEVHARRGSTVTIRAASMAYCAQTPWLQRGTIRSNILLGRTWDAERYERVLEACELREDIMSMPRKDLTEVGDRGSTLSGGQRLRVALARALYGRAEIYLLDDPFSGLDPQTASAVVRKAVLGMIRSERSTAIVVTHLLPLFEGFDYILAVRGGQVVRKEYLKPRQQNARAASPPMAETAGLPSADTGSKPRVTCPLVETLCTDAPQDLHTVEAREEGTVQWSVYLCYIRSCGWVVSCLILVSLLAMQASQNGFNFWLSIWSTENERFSTRQFLVISGIIVGCNSLLTLIRSFIFAYGGLRAARLLHDCLLKAVITARMSFFDQNPTGRVLNRFSADIFTVDNQLPFMLNILLAQSAALLGSSVVMIGVSPWTALVLLLLVPFYYRLQRHYRASSREFKRLESTSRSPIFALFAETFDGSPTIRALAAQETFRTQNLLHVDENSRVVFMSCAASQWLALRLQMFGVVVVTFVAAWAVCSSLAFGTVNAGHVGLGLSYTLPIVGNLSAVLSAFTETEKDMVSVERIENHVDEPAEPELTGDGRTLLDDEDGADLMAAWPWAGAISINDLTLRYRPGLPLALDHVSCVIGQGEKVGLCGRTGSSKSSLLAALFRLAPWQGSVLVDGVPINRVPLKKLRSSVGIMPQEPATFSGTIRFNLDPHKEHTDQELFNVLQACKLDAMLHERYGSLSSCLSAEIESKGMGLSLGEKQLLCLCRALLRRTPILCVDEASANLDVATDAIIRRVIAQTFNHATVIYVAHRISSLVELCSRVIVMADGRMVEQGDPAFLLKDPCSHLSRLAHEGREQER